MTECREWLLVLRSYPLMATVEPSRAPISTDEQVVDLPIPDGDIAVALGSIATAFKASLQAELQGRQTIKSAYQGKYCNQGRKQQGLAMLKEGKKAQAKARLAKEKLRTLVAALQANVLRNQEVGALEGP